MTIRATSPFLWTGANNETRRKNTSPDLIGSVQAIKRAAQRAREIARQTNSPCIIRKDGKLIDIAKTSGFADLDVRGTHLNDGYEPQ